MQKTQVPFFKKYCPNSVKEIIGQEEIVSTIIKYIQDYKKQKKKALLLHGLTGTGKTVAVYAIAHDLDLEIVEVNASDFRNEAGINLVVGAAVSQMSLFSKGKIILVDEVDGIAGTEDRGGLNALIKLIEKTTFPIVLTANNVADYKYNSLKTKCLVLEFAALSSNSIYNIIKKISEQEKLKIKDEVLKSVSRLSGGDARAAINDLQTLAGFNDEIKDLDILGERNRQDTIINALLKILKSTDVKVAKGAFDNVDEDFDQCFLWLDENMPKEYTKPEDLARAYDVMSRADVFKGRIRRWQHWRFMVYISDLLTAGVALSKKEKYPGLVGYKPTMKLLKIWQANMKYAKRKAIAKKVAVKTHTSTRAAIQSTVPYMKIIFQKDKKQAEELSEYFELEEEEKQWLCQ